MTDAPRTRPKRSRAGLVLFLALMAAGAWYLVDWMKGGGSLEGSPYISQPYVNYGLKPSFARRVSDNAPWTRTSNSHGFRGPEFAVPKPAGTFRIVCLGGSTTYSELVDDADAYPVLLEQILREKRPDLSIEVVNAGVPSYTTAESLANLAYRCLDFEPDAIVVYHAANDVRPRTYANFEPSYYHYRKVWDGTTRNQEFGEGDMGGGINTLIQMLPPADNGDHAQNVSRSSAGAYRRNLISMIGMARAHGAESVLVSFADAGLGTRGHTAVLHDGIAEHNLVMADVAREHDAVFVDLAEALSREGTFADPVHLNPTGTRQKAEIIAEGIAPLLP